METSLNCGGAGGGKEGEGKKDQEEGEKMTKGEEKSGSTAMKKSESCSCVCGKIATSSVLNTHKHQQMFSEKSGKLMLMGLMKMKVLAVPAMKTAVMLG